jgi:hypothetical protein
MERPRPLTFIAFAVLCTAQVVGQFTYDARIQEYTGFRYACGDEVVPVLKIVNNGTATMITCVVETWKNGSPVGSFDWQLAVPALQGDVRQPALPGVGGVALGDVLEFRIISVNEQADQNSEGNVLEVEMDQVPAMADSYLVMLEVLTDEAPEETTWAMHDQAGQVVAQGGPYATAGTTEQVWLPLQPSACYELRVTDAQGDGMAGGHVKVFSNGVEVVSMEGTALTDRYVVGLVTGTEVGVGELHQRSVELYPNPTTGAVRSRWMGATTTLIDVRVMDAMGRMVQQAVVNASRVEIDLSRLEPGSYTILLTDASGARYRSAVVRE